MRIIKLFLISILIFLFICSAYFFTPSYYKYEISDWFSRLSAPSFDTQLDVLSVKKQAEIMTKYKDIGYKLNCYGNLRDNEKIGKHGDYLCWALINSAFDNIPARSITFFFYQEKLHHVRLEFPESSLKELHSYIIDKSPSVSYPRKDDIEWVAKNGIVTTSRRTTAHGHVIVLWSSFQAILLDYNFK